MILALVLLACLGISMLFNVGQLAGNLFSGRPVSYHATRVSGPRLDELVREDNGALNKIAVIEVSGIIMSDAFDQGVLGWSKSSKRSSSTPKKTPA